jgi:uncharacterized integral membrane protein
MATLLASVALGVLFALFATQNTSPVTLNFGGRTLANIPIYLAILIPLLTGLTLALLFHIVKGLSQNLTISEQKDQMKNLKKELAEVTKDAHKFQLENTKLKTENGNPEDEDSI